jgi:CDP-glucose 4,6-dehydratase
VSDTHVIARQRRPRVTAPFSGFFRGRRVLVTGHTGFKGTWLSLWLRSLGAEVHGLALAPEPGACLYEIVGDGIFAREHIQDIRDFEGLRAALAASRPQLVFHLAAQALVQTSFIEPLATFATNALGTANLLDAVKALQLSCDVIVVTSDKCYDNQEWDFPYREGDALGGGEVYGMSKAAAELVARAWNQSFFSTNDALGRVVTARAGNVIGGGDFANNRIVPDCARALAAEQPIPVRNPGSLRPWQHVLDCLSGYLCLAERLAGEPKDSALVSPFNFGPVAQDVRTVADLVEEMLKHWPGSWEKTGVALAGPEAQRLRLAIDKAGDLIDWTPTWDFADAVRQTAIWYRKHAAGEPAGALKAFTLAQIAAFEDAARARGVAWAGE